MRFFVGFVEEGGYRKGRGFGLEGLVRVLLEYRLRGLGRGFFREV